MTSSLPAGLEQPAPLREGEAPRNWATVLTGTKKIAKEPRAFPDDPPEGFVQVNIKRCGICGSDLHVWEGVDMNAKKSGYPLPMVMGHEASGIVTKLGPKVDTLKVGQAVAVMPWTYFGLLATHINHPAALCLPLPEGVSLEEGAYTEPLAVGLNAARRAKVEEGSTVLIIGSGSVGLAALACSLAMGAKKVVVTDLSESRLEAARNCGATATVNTTGLDPMEAAYKVAEAVTGKPYVKGEAPLGFEVGVMENVVDCVIDAAGFSSSVMTAVYAVKPGGSISIVGLGSSLPTVPILSATIKEANIYGAFGYGATGYADALKMIGERKVDVSKLVSHRLPMDKVQYGYEICHGTKDGAVKVIFSTDEE
ncbi:chaperonin 10-like protein [Hyaloraphidium curvatum]|nr:chaperonin 10-like protein [Hyaloraphidium curvatum]